MNESTTPECLGSDEIALGALVPGENVRKSTGLGEDDIEALALDIGNNGLLEPLLVYLNDDDTATVWNGHRRFAALTWLSENSPELCPEVVPCRIYERPTDLVAAQLRANNYRELSGNELARALYNYFVKGRRKDWTKQRDAQKQMYTRGVMGRITQATGMSGPIVSRLGAVAGWDDLMALWDECPEIGQVAMYDAARLLTEKDRCGHFLGTGLASRKALESVYGEAVVTELLQASNGGKSDTGPKKPGAKAVKSLLETADQQKTAYCRGIAACARYVLGTSGRPGMTDPGEDTTPPE